MEGMPIKKKRLHPSLELYFVNENPDRKLENTELDIKATDNSFQMMIDDVRQQRQILNQVKKKMGVNLESILRDGNAF